jgi:hypothetical protein
MKNPASDIKANGKRKMTKAKPPYPYLCRTKVLDNLRNERKWKPDVKLAETSEEKRTRL